MTTGRSRIDISTQAPKGRSVPTKRFDVGMLIGPATWGPMHEATVSIDYTDFYEKFGGMMPGYHTTMAAKLAFDAGLQRLIFTRVCHIADHTASSTPATAAKATATFTTAAGGTYSALATLQIDALYHGTRANSFVIKIQTASNGEATRFDLLVYEGTTLREWFRNLSMLDSDARYVETIVNTAVGHSLYVVATDLALGGAGGAAADERPENAAGTTMTGGDDGNGTTGAPTLVSADYVGASTYNTGLYAFNLQEDGDLLFCVDDTSTSFQNSATTYCDAVKSGKVLFVVDVPASSSKTGVVAHAQALTASEYRTAVYWPRVKIANPSKSIFGEASQITVAASPLIIGRMSRNSNAEQGKHWTQPGNEIYGLLDLAVDVETDAVLEPTVRDYVTDYGVNPIVKGTRSLDGNFGVWCDDVLLGQTTLNFVSVGEQRGMCYLRKIFEAYLQQHRTQANTPNRRRTIKEAFEAELVKQLGWGVFASTNAEEAFYVNTDPEGTSLNNPAVQDEQRMRILVGVATARPGRFLELVFMRDNRGVESWIQQQLVGANQ